jgi:hypothetical protein
VGENDFLATLTGVIKLFDDLSLPFPWVISQSI